MQASLSDKRKKEAATLAHALYKKFILECGEGQLDNDDIEAVLKELYQGNKKKLVKMTNEFLSVVIKTVVDDTLGLNLLAYICGENLQDKITTIQSVSSVAEARSFKAYQRNVIKEIGGYISWYKFSLFGHHHDGRARAVRAAIAQCETREEIQQILTNQAELMQSVPVSTAAPGLRFLDSRWSLADRLVNKCKNPATSGYNRVIQGALKVR